MTDRKNGRTFGEPDRRSRGCSRGETFLSVRAVLAVVLAVLPVAGAAAWEYSEFSFDAEARAAVMASVGDWNPYFEAKGTFHGADGEFRYHSFVAGSYFRAAPWLKVGAFYRLEGNPRHVDDWTVIDEVGPIETQYWEGVSGRYEHSLLLDATPRFLLSGLPGEKWVTATKVRYAYNMSAGLHTLLLRPGITYVVLPNREPVLNLTLSYPVYLALNGNDHVLYGHGPYFSALWHARGDLKLEGRLEFQMKRYGKTAFGGPWTLRSRHLTAGLGLIYTPDFR